MTDCLDDVTWGGWCPVQGYGLIDGCAVYFRARWTSWSLEIGRGPEVDEYGGPAHTAWVFRGEYGMPGEAGWMNDFHVRWCLLVSVAVWRARGGRQADACVVTLMDPFVPGGSYGFDRFTLTDGERR